MEKLFYIRSEGESGKNARTNLLMNNFLELANSVLDTTPGKDPHGITELEDLQIQLLSLVLSNVTIIAHASDYYKFIVTLPRNVRRTIFTNVVDKCKDLLMTTINASKESGFYSLCLYTGESHLFIDVNNKQSAFRLIYNIDGETIEDIDTIKTTSKILIQKLSDMFYKQIEYVYATIVMNREVTPDRFALCCKCGDIFYRRKNNNRKYCSKLCGGATRMQRYRDKHGIGQPKKYNIKRKIISWDHLIG